MRARLSRILFPCLAAFSALPVLCALLYAGYLKISTYFPPSPALYPLKESYESAVVLTDEQKAKRVNLNTADKEQLMTLSGIGEKTAEKILDYRAAHGDFRVVDELLLVKGIGETILNNIYEWVYVE